MFTSAERIQLREALIASARSDERISGVALTGSAVAGAEDRWSDVDLAFGVSGDADTGQVIAEWTEQMYGEHAVCCERDPQPADQRKRLLTLLQAGADVHAADKNGVTALHHAVRFRSPAAVKVFIEHGADVNRQCRRNRSTPLHRAVTQMGAPGTAGRAQAAREIVELLLAAGADPSIKNKMGKRAADYVSDNAIRSLLE